MMRLSVIWPRCTPPDVMEISHSYAFCRKTTRRLFEESDHFSLQRWYDLWDGPWADTMDPSGVDNGAQPLSFSNGTQPLFFSNEGAIQDEVDALLLVMDPEVVIAPVAVERMLGALASGADVVFPVFNESSASMQSATLPAVYLNLSTYLEVAAMVSVSMESSLKEPSYLEAAAMVSASMETPLRDRVVSEAAETQIGGQGDGDDKGGRLFFLKDHSDVWVDASCLMVSPKDLGKVMDRLWAQSAEMGWMNGVCGDLFKGIHAVVERSALVHRFGVYGSGERGDLADLVPETAGRLLDVGCAQGGFGAMMRSKRPDLHLIGVEMSEVLARKARPHYDHVHVEKIERVTFAHRFDHINCGDIIEHLYDPWEAFRRFHTLLEPGGTLVVSLPNVGHWSVVRDLAAGAFPYLPFGLTCITHIRWFTESSLREALHEAGFTIDRFCREAVSPTPQGAAFIEMMCRNGGGDRTSLSTHQFTLRVVKK